MDLSAARPMTASRPPGRSTRAMAVSAAAKSMWCSEVLAQTKSKLASAKSWARKSASMKVTRAGPAVRDRATAIMRGSRSMPVTWAQRAASRPASIPSPQPTSSAARQPGGTAPRMTGW